MSFDAQHQMVGVTARLAETFALQRPSSTHSQWTRNSWSRGARVRGLVVMALVLVGLFAPAAAPAASVSVDVTVELGGLLPIGTSSCSLCANFVTTFDRDGTAGPLAPSTRMQRNLMPNVPYALDVDGTLSPMPLGIFPLPGYELRATVQALAADRPTVKLSKLATAPALMPLRVEIVTGDVTSDAAAKTSFGYDTLDGTAPSSFTAALDVTDRDSDATTVNAFADLTIDTAARRLTIITESFNGPADGARSNRKIRRLTYRGDPAKATAVPRRASIDVTSATRSLRTILTRDLRSTLDVELIEPAGGPHTTATLDELPSRADLTIADDDLNGDGDLDKRVAYTAASVVKRAELRIDQGQTSLRAGVDDLPSDVRLTFAAQDNGTAATSDDSTQITYNSNGRATRAELRREDGSKVLTASLDQLPSNINDLRYLATPHGGRVVYLSDGRAQKGSVEVSDGPKSTKARLTNLPEDMDLTWSSTPAKSHAHYLADGVADRADVELTDELGQKTSTSLLKVPSNVRLDFTKSDGALDVQYSASSQVPSAEIHGTDFRGLPDRANQLHVLLKGVPTKLGFRIARNDTTTIREKEVDPPDACERMEDPTEDPSCPGHPDYVPPKETTTTTEANTDLSVTTPVPGSRLGTGEIQMTSGPDDRLPETAPKGNPQDGVLVRDLEDRFVVFARVSQFDELVLQRHNQVSKTTGPGLPRPESRLESMHASLDTSAGDHALAIDIKKGSASTVESTKALLISLPSHIELDTYKNSTLQEDRTTWRASRPVDGWANDTVLVPGFSFSESSTVNDETPVITKTLTLDPMPSTFTVCKLAFSPRCSGGTFNENINRLAAGDNDTGDCGIESNCLTGHSRPMPVDPSLANKGSILITANPATRFHYAEGSSTLVDFDNLERFGLQAHKESTDCGLLDVECPFGYLAMDTGGSALSGVLKQVSDGTTTRFDFPAVGAGEAGWSADNHVWSFEKVGALQGFVASAGPINCPDGTTIKAADEVVTERFCFGDLLDNDFPG